jgi:hypothetical protein
MADEAAQAARKTQRFAAQSLVAVVLAVMAAPWWLTARLAF